ncbi:hypothetical protein [Embleya sp. AB8]|uniref:hypothetical protein n=1 Tax=Embleya sp. AB8 TaxID=3156304 RepID=UPI003C780162
MTGTGDQPTIRFTSPSDHVAELAPAIVSPQLGVEGPEFVVGDPVRRRGTRWRDSGEIIGIRCIDAGPLYTVRRWMDRSLYDATAAELFHDPDETPLRDPDGAS